jgi:hypothetical protein
VNFAATFLIFVVERFDAFDAEAHHGLVANFSRELFVTHARDVEIGVAAVDACVAGRRCVAKSFFEAADFGPPFERFRSIGGRENGNCAFDDCVHVGEDSGIWWRNSIVSDGDRKGVGLSGIGGAAIVRERRIIDVCS